MTNSTVDNLNSLLTNKQNKLSVIVCLFTIEIWVDEKGNNPNIDVKRSEKRLQKNEQYHFVHLKMT
ncbi:MAG: hypothetical protein WD381_00880 [Balneolaceae bacterium]